MEGASIQTCEKCGAQLADEPKLAVMGVYLCRRCGEIYQEPPDGGEPAPFDPMLGTIGLAGVPLLPTPETMEWEELGSSLTLRLRPSLRGLIWPLWPMMGCALALGAILVSSAPLWQRGTIDGWAWWWIGGASLPLVLALFGSLYLCLPLIEAAFRSAAVHLSPEGLSVSPGPFVGGRRQRFELDEMRRVFCKKRRRRVKGVGEVFHYEVLVNLEPTGRVRLLGHLDRPEEAIFVAQRLQTFLNLLRQDELAASV